MKRQEIVSRVLCLIFIFGVSMVFADERKLVYPPEMVKAREALVKSPL